jgi:hypothetical protein
MLVRVCEVYRVSPPQSYAGIEALDLIDGCVCIIRVEDFNFAVGKDQRAAIPMRYRPQNAWMAFNNDGTSYRRKLVTARIGRAAYRGGA